ncbi:MAG: hypothetical protein U0271_32865 [Polyangiaceae bacterium]
MVPFFVASTRCECQATLTVLLTEQRYVVSGSAFLLGKREPAPAHAIHPEQPVFDIGVLCPFCNRNVMRTFAAVALQRYRAPAPAA